MMIDVNDFEVIINNQRLIMQALVEHFQNKQISSKTFEAIRDRLVDLDDRQRTRFPVR